jgi:hypothetical protein
MTLARVFYILGIVCVVWALVSGLSFHYTHNGFEGNLLSSYKFKLGLFLLGLLLLIFGYRAQKKADPER